MIEINEEDEEETSENKFGLFIAVTVGLLILFGVFFLGGFESGHGVGVADGKNKVYSQHYDWENQAVTEQHFRDLQQTLVWPTPKPIIYYAASHTDGFTIFTSAQETPTVRGALRRITPPGGLDPKFSFCYTTVEPEVFNANSNWACYDHPLSNVR